MIGEDDTLAVMKQDIGDFVVESEINLIRPEVRDDHEFLFAIMDIRKDIRMVMVDEFKLAFKDLLVDERVFA